jgi:hypothetical protein
VVAAHLQKVVSRRRANQEEFLNHERASLFVLWITPQRLRVFESGRSVQTEIYARRWISIRHGETNFRERKKAKFTSR